MALTPAEQAELEQLEREEREEQERQQGQKAVAAVQAQRTPQNRPRPFSLYRATVGALRDAAQGVLDTIDDAGDYLQKKAPLPSVVFGSAAKNGIVGIRSAEETTKAVTSDRALGTLPTLKGEEDAGTAEAVVRGIGSFLVPFTAASKAVGVLRGGSWLGRAGRAMTAGAIADFVQVDPVSGNMANFVRDTFGIDNATLDALASEEDDEALYNRFKAAIVNAPVGLAADALFETGFRAVKAYRAWKGTAEEAEETIKAIKRDYAIEPVKRPKAPANDNPAAAGKGGPEDVEFWEVPHEYNPTRDADAAPHPTSFEDVLDYLKRQSGLEVDEQALARLADNLLWGNPENALTKLGLDPLKLDFSLYDDPDMMARLQKGLAEVYETIASKLGRSNIRVTERATVGAARALASTADVLKDVHGATANLAEGLMGARLFVGAHAHKLLAQADEAIEEILAGSAGPKWDAFLDSFHRHAYYIGVVRGAGSEVGRALRSLQIIGKVAKPEELNATLGKALGQDAKEGRVLDAVKSRVEKGASDYADRLGTDAEKLEALQRLKALGGDVGELTREVRRQNGSILRRIDDALRETVGNLFSTGTAMYNMAAGASMLGTRLMAKGLVAIARMALSPLGGQFSREARIALMDTWAYMDGVVSGFRAAYAATLDVLEKEGFAEVAHNLDSMGLKDLALKSAKGSADADSRLVGGSYERTDVKNHRAFGVTATEQLALQRKIAELSGPEFYRQALGFLAKAGASTVNAVGTLSRAGTIAFINLPDQFIGTLAAQAGAYSKAVRIAASEAAELSLEGRDLSQYLKARSVQLMGDPKGWHPDPVRAGEREAIYGAGEREAREVLFQDELELSLNRAVSRGLTNAVGVHLIVPFVKTPLRILERTAIDYTPLGLLKDRVRRAIIAGGPQGEEAMARIALGSLALTSAYLLAADRTIVGQDGGLASSARLSRGSYTLRIGDDQIEFSRVDPLGTLLGFGADLHAFIENMADDPEAPGHFQQAAEAFLWATTANILSKSWLTSVRNLADLAGTTGDGSDLDVRFTRFLSQFASRFVPASGAQRQAEKALDGYTRQAVTFTDQLFKSSFGADTLPLKRDTIVGRPVPVEGLDRLIGVRAAPAAGDDDPLLKELEALSFDLPSPRRTVLGVKLNGAQFSRYLELRGQVLTKPDTGLNLEQTLTKLIELPEYQQMSRRARIEAIREEMQGFSQMATDALLREDKAFAYRALRKETFDRVLVQGGDRQAADAETRRFAAQLGLTPTE